MARAAGPAAGAGGAGGAQTEEAGWCRALYSLGRAGRAAGHVLGDDRRPARAASWLPPDLKSARGQGGDVGHMFTNFKRLRAGRGARRQRPSRIPIARVDMPQPGELARS
eukprot:CAMPEP_0179244118 /NCGR_PEP_ID=MMETSP0797-20121207/17893_1 /TAXON_ID=47934 /ORGANISM="Dinophysis acuminata, Strain DAEP01" /LENGTH=109 /DNA_ID=CAMNT_0020951625 /DNA_START=1 /DNA_END=327 /DNA_ORIENTATION=+